MMGLDTRFLVRFDEMRRIIDSASKRERVDEFLRDDVLRLRRLVTDIESLMGDGPVAQLVRAGDS